MCVYIFIYIYVDVYIYILKIEKSKGNPHQMTCEKVHFGPFHGHSPNYKKVCTKTPKQTHTHTQYVFVYGWALTEVFLSLLVCPQWSILSLYIGLPSRSIYRFSLDWSALKVPVDASLPVCACGTGFKH